MRAFLGALRVYPTQNHLPDPTVAVPPPLKLSHSHISVTHFLEQRDHWSGPAPECDCLTVTYRWHLFTTAGHPSACWSWSATPMSLGTHGCDWRWIWDRILRAYFGLAAASKAHCHRQQPPSPNFQHPASLASPSTTRKTSSAAPESARPPHHCPCGFPSSPRLIGTSRC